MKLSFFKYHGAGNDFILIDNSALLLKLSKELVSMLCDRHLGIGADGLILLTNKKGYNFGMVYFNSDGNESTLCGNGGRCITAFANHLGLIDKNASFLAIDGEHHSEIIEISESVMQISLKMNDVTVNEPVNGCFFIDTGSPHYVIFADDVRNIKVVERGRKIRYGKSFSEEGTNVDFVEINNDSLFVRTYERGVEDETLSCGTGVTAAALTDAFFRNKDSGVINVKTLGGDLSVSFQRDGQTFKEVWLTGPVKFVFKGEIEV